MPHPFVAHELDSEIALPYLRKLSAFPSRRGNHGKRLFHLDELRLLPPAAPPATKVRGAAPTPGPNDLEDVLQHLFVPVSSYLVSYHVVASPATLNWFFELDPHPIVSAEFPKFPPRGEQHFVTEVVLIDHDGNEFLRV
jgi:hypothetical protein